MGGGGICHESVRKGVEVGLSAETFVAVRRIPVAWDLILKRRLIDKDGVCEGGCAIEFGVGPVMMCQCLRNSMKN